MKNSSKGFGGTISTLIMFIAVLSVTVMVVVFIKDQVFQTENILREKGEIESEKTATILTIASIDYNGSVLDVYVKNTGRTNVDVDKIDVYVDGEYMTNFTSYDSSGTTDIRILNPPDTSLFEIDVGLSGGSHKIRLVTSVGASVEELFTT
jgi:archaellum component FlaG (FlaF/FlaG flagellin family)